MGGVVLGPAEGRVARDVDGGIAMYTRALDMEGLLAAADDVEDPAPKVARGRGIWGEGVVSCQRSLLSG